MSAIECCRESTIFSQFGGKGRRPKIEHTDLWCLRCVFLTACAVWAASGAAFSNPWNLCSLLHAPRRWWAPFLPVRGRPATRGAGAGSWRSTGLFLKVTTRWQRSRGGSQGLPKPGNWGFSQQGAVLSKTDGGNVWEQWACLSKSLFCRHSCKICCCCQPAAVPGGVVCRWCVLLQKRLCLSVFASCLNMSVAVFGIWMCFRAFLRCDRPERGTPGFTDLPGFQIFVFRLSFSRGLLGNHDVFRSFGVVVTYVLIVDNTVCSELLLRHWCWPWTCGKPGPAYSWIGSVHFVFLRL